MTTVYYWDADDSTFTDGYGCMYLMDSPGSVPMVEKQEYDRVCNNLESEVITRTMELSANMNHINEIEQRLKNTEELLAKSIPDFIKLSPEMKEAGDREVAAARYFGCASVNALEAAFFEAAIQVWIDQQQYHLEISANMNNTNDLKQSSKNEEELLAKAIYNSWRLQAGFTPWVENGNSRKQDEARKIARNQLTSGVSKKVEAPIKMPTPEQAMQWVMHYQDFVKVNVTGTTNWAANLGMYIAERIKELNGGVK